VAKLHEGITSEVNHLSTVVEKHRKPESSVDPLFLNRWSSRAFSEQEVSEEVLSSILEAATWAPSASNEQPWRFVIARTKEERALFQDFINARNQLWSQKAPVLILLGSAKKRSNNTPNSSHSFDAGAAWGYLALQAKLLGLNTRAIGGFDKDKARELLNIPGDIELHAVVALGYNGNVESLYEDFQKLEIPTSRRSVRKNIISI